MEQIYLDQAFRLLSNFNICASSERTAEWAHTEREGEHVRKVVHS